MKKRSFTVITNLSVAGEKKEKITHNLKFNKYVMLGKTDDNQDCSKH